eukprot:2343548-Pyramimonas_sp.AAC.3
MQRAAASASSWAFRCPSGRVSSAYNSRRTAWQKTYPGGPRCCSDTINTCAARTVTIASAIRSRVIRLGGEQEDHSRRAAHREQRSRS